MKTKKSVRDLGALVFMAALVLGFNAVAPQSTAAQTPALKQVPNGEKVRKYRGIVFKRSAEMFLMGDHQGGPQTVVIVTPETKVKSHKKGLFRGSRKYEQADIVRGLRLEVDGVGNAEGQLVAKDIRFDEQDLRIAQALRSTVDPLETDLRTQLAQQRSEQEKLAGQLQETQAVAVSARAEAAAAQTSANQAGEAAKQAQSTADAAHNRINGLDDYVPVKTITVYFNTGSSTLNQKAKATIDEAAAWVRTQDRKGWVAEVVGYADSRGNTIGNRNLSEQRAKAVIYYMATEQKLPINRLVQPFGYGELDDNGATSRAKNRRVEIRLMKNKGIAGGTRERQIN
jgi:outer membrane protein OmpA-like peptidoglycan-associated protein